MPDPASPSPAAAAILAAVLGFALGRHTIRPRRPSPPATDRPAPLWHPELPRKQP